MKKVFLLLFLSLSACSFTPTIGQDLVGQNKKFVQKKLGKPVVFRTESPNQIYSYRIDNCSILVYFDQSDTVQFVDYTGNCS